MISYILFDLDNTLYPSDAGMEEATMRRILAYASSFLGISPDEVRAQRAAGMRRYGTTLEWLMSERGLTDVDGYYAAVHPDGEEEDLRPDPRIRGFLQSLPVPCGILTNSPIEHAERVLRKIELDDLFKDIFDIRWNGLEGKPAEGAFRRALAAIGKRVEEVLFVDDLPAYVEGFIRLGGMGVLIDHEDRHPNAPYPRIRSIEEITRFLGEAAPCST